MAESDPAVASAAMSVAAIPKSRECSRVPQDEWQCPLSAQSDHPEHSKGVGGALLPHSTKKPARQGRRARIRLENEP